MNLLWIMADQLRADCLGFMGHPAAQTPHLDRLAADSIVFDNAYCQSPVCMASRAVLFTGRYPGTNGVRGMGILPPSEIPLPEVLQRHGYRTGAFGKVHLTPEQYTRTVLQRDTPTLDLADFLPHSGLEPMLHDPCKRWYGFQEYDGCEDILLGRHQAWLREHQPRLANQPATPFHPSGPSDLIRARYPSEWHPTTYIGQQTAAFIRRQQGGTQPWFAFCSFIAPHHPFEAPDDQIARYRGAPLQAAGKGGVDPRSIPFPAAQVIGEFERYPVDIQRQIVLHYLASISLIDDAVGQVLDVLRRSGQADDTIILFTSDHGEFAGNHGLLRKPSIHFDELIRVPLLVHVPGGTLPPRREAGLVELTDVCPTLLGLLEIAPPPGLQGIDWTAALRRRGTVGREDIYADMFDLEPMTCGRRGGPYQAVQTLRTPEWKLNLYPTAGSVYGQLFNVREDPDESRNRYGDPSCRDVLGELLWRLASRLHGQTDPLPPFLTQF